MKFSIASWLLLAIFASLASASLAANLKKKKIKNLVTFGDSYTDVVITGDAGISWPTYAADYAQVSLYPFARAGATCSNNITFRPFPPLFESQLPLYFTEKNNGSLNLDAKETLYTLWIGTNDLGVNSLISGNNNASLVDVANCMVDWVKVLYESGARNFLFQNMIPLEKTPLYSTDSYPNRYWSAQRNTTQWSNSMTELTLSGNALTKLLLTALAPTLPDSHIGYFDSHALFTDMYTNPARYLNGTAPLNVTGAISSCVFELNGSTGVCTTVTDPKAQDSYLWYDELHPSEQADRVVAREIATIIEGKDSRWTTWLS
ncbi:GDSL esterase/lipase [Termitomyces sp. T112]|nr:GDSL esterase/lipase [Termitomyces sp. T112]